MVTASAILSSRGACRRFFSATAGLLTVFLLNIILLEVVLRCFFPLCEADLHKQIVRQNLPGLQEYVMYERNEFGFRSLSMKTVEKPPGTFRIICLGGSTTDQATQNTADTWSALLEKKLTESYTDLGVDIEIASWAESGGPVRMRRQWAESGILRYSPDMVIILEGINDMCFHGGPGYGYSGSPADDGDLFNGMMYSVVSKKVLEHSQFYLRLKILDRRLKNYHKLATGKALEWHSRNLPEMREGTRRLPYVENPVRDPDPIREFSDELYALILFLTGNGIEVVVLGQPVLWNEAMTPEEMAAIWFPVYTSDGKVRTDGAWLGREISRYNEVQKRIAGHFGATYVDLNGRIPKSLQYFFDDCHFTDLGSARVAEELFPLVKERVDALIFPETECMN